MKELDNGGDLELTDVALGTTASIGRIESGAVIGQKVDFESNEISPTNGNSTTLSTHITKEDYKEFQDAAEQQTILSRVDTIDLDDDRVGEVAKMKVIM